MRLALYVPKAQADRWSPTEGSISFGELQSRIVNLAGGLTLSSTIGRWTGGSMSGPRSTADGHTTEPMYVLEVFASHDKNSAAYINEDRYARLWALLRAYAAHLIDSGEESVLVVQDNEPTLIFA